ncbi:MAG: HDOD domain-containing protein [Proteobacteria bacterium]|nr:HDOD domain-containing protein [Pseudomonadota bacterium]MCP4920501.1 HDOD domain-containing protein [Pseudomonadota bacterium]
MWFSAPFRAPPRKRRITRRPEPEVALTAGPRGSAPWTRGVDAPSLEPIHVRRHVLDGLHEAEVAARSFDDRAFLRRLQSTIATDDLGLPPFPGTVVELKRLLSRGVEVPAARLALVIEKDHALVEAVLRQARGPAWRTPPDSLRTAVTRVGNDALWRASMRFALEATVFHVPGYQHRVEEIREHSLVVAEIAAWMLGDAEDRGGAWLAGLLHDIGKLVIYKEAGRLGAPVSESVLHDVIDRMHASIGFLVARRWEFAEVEAGAIALHHGTTRMPGGPGRLAAYLRAADIAAHGAQARRARQATTARQVLVADFRGLGFDADAALNVADQASMRLSRLQAA